MKPKWICPSYSSIKEVEILGYFNFKVKVNLFEMDNFIYLTTDIPEDFMEFGCECLTCKYYAEVSDFLTFT